MGKVIKRKLFVGIVILAAVCCGSWWLSRQDGERGEAVESVESLEKVELVDSVESFEQIESIERIESVETIESVEQIEKGESLAQYKLPDPSIPRVRQAATANRLFVAPEAGRSVEESFAATQTPSARGTVPYVLVPTTKYDESHVSRLDALGVRRLGYFPPNGILVELTEAQFKTVSEEPMFALVGEWRAGDKIDPRVARHVEEGRREATIVTCDGADPGALAQIVADAGGRVTAGGAEANGWLRVDFADGKDVIGALAARGEVRWIEPYVQPRGCNDYAVLPANLNVKPVWNTHGLTGRGQIVAVCDSGLDTGDTSTLMADFTNRVLTIINKKYTTGDYTSHGTHVAGSLFGSGVLSGGTYRGVAYEAQAVVFACGPTNYFDEAFYGIPYEFSTALGSHPYRIHSNSWSMKANGAYDYTCRRADADCMNHPYLFVAMAAGNDGDGAAPTTGSPGTAKNVLTVGNCYSSRSGNSPDNRSPDSSYGTKDGRFKPDLMATGQTVVSDRSSLSMATAYNTPDGRWLTDYTEMNGTSMATPLASGCATLTRQWLVERRGFTEPSSALVKAILTGGANGSRPTQEQGWGRINLENSLFPANGVVYLYDYDNPTLALTADSQCVASFTATNAAPMRVQLAWIDPAASDGASTALVNDHDLVVSNATTGAFWIGNDFDGTRAFDTINNIEGVRIASTVAGQEYRIYIRGRTTQATGTSRPALYVVAAARENTGFDREDGGAGRDELNRVPRHWYTFDTNLASCAAEECFNGSGTGENDPTVYATNNVASQSGRALVTVHGSLHPYGTMTSSAAFTLMASIKSVETTNAVLLSIGKNSENGIVLVANGRDGVKLIPHTGSTANAAQEIAVSDATSRYHHYAFVYADGQYTLYVDGEAKGNAISLAQSNRGVQLGGLYGGLAFGVTRVSGVAIDDFRVYAEAFGAETVAQYAALFPPSPVVDELGALPRNWYTFDADMSSSGLGECLAGGENANADYATNNVPSQSGRALVTLANVIHPWGTMASYTNFTLTASLKSVEPSDSVLLSVGREGENGFTLASAGANGVKLVAHNGSSVVSTQTLPVEKAATRYHHYAFAYTNGQLKAYIDGVATGDAVSLSQPARGVQLGGQYGGPAFGLTRASGVAVDDFRVYAEAFDAATVARYAAHFPPWELVVTVPGSIPAWNGVTFDYVFRGVADGDWDNLANWYANAFEVATNEVPWTTNWPSAYSGTVVPGATGSGAFNPTLLDGDLMSAAVPVNADGRKAVSKDNDPNYEGWSSFIGVRNNVELTIAHMRKLQSPNGSTSTWLVDATSRIVVNDSVPDAAQSQFNFLGQIFDVEAPEGVQFLGSVTANGAMTFKLHDEGSVSFKGLSTRNNANIAWTVSADLDWGASTDAGTEVRERRLIGWTGKTAQLSFAPGTIGGTYSDSDAGPTATSGAVSASAPVGTYQLVTDSTGLLIKWVAKAPVSTIYIDNADSTTTPLAVPTATIALLAERGGVESSALNDTAANGLRVWENILLGITDADDDDAEKLTLSIEMVNGSPVVSSPTGALADVLSLENPTQTFTVGALTATATLEQSDALGDEECWTTASSGSLSDARFYRVAVRIATE